MQTATPEPTYGVSRDHDVSILLSKAIGGLEYLAETTGDARSKAQAETIRDWLQEARTTISSK